MSNQAIHDEATYSVRADAIAECERLSEENARLRLHIKAREAESRQRRRARRDRAKYNATLAVLYGLACTAGVIWGLVK